MKILALSSWRELLHGVPEGSILGLLLFNIFLCDLFHFLEVTDIASYADDTTPYYANSTKELIITKLEESFSILFKWFNNDYMKVNIGKSHPLMFGNKNAIAHAIAITTSSSNRYVPYIEQYVSHNTQRRFCTKDYPL